MLRLNLTKSGNGVIVMLMTRVYTTVAEKGQPTSADPVAARPNYSGQSALRPFNWREIFKTGCALIGISRHAVHAG